MDRGHIIQFALIRPGDAVSYGNNGHILGVIPAKGRRVGAYLIFAAHKKSARAVVHRKP